MVCTECARLGWLLVFGGDTAEQPRKRKRVVPADPRQLTLAAAARAADTARLVETSEAALPSPHGSRAVVTVEAAKQQLNPKGRKRSRRRKP
jgi:nicotinic acid mononucleotide adenylyltransferase